MIRVLEMSLLLSLVSLPLAAEKSEFVGTWHGRMNELPVLDITLEESSGEIRGSIMFYLQMRGEDGKWYVKGKHSQTLLLPKLRGRILEFEVTHHKAHGSPELGPNVPFRMELDRDGSAILYKTDEPIRGPGLKLTRTVK
jgi:hypothetical protein